MCDQLDAPRHAEAMEFGVANGFEDKQVESALKYRDSIVRQSISPIERRYESALIDSAMSMCSFSFLSRSQAQPERGPKAALVRQWKNMAGWFHPGPLRN